MKTYLILYLTFYNEVYIFTPHKELKLFNGNKIGQKIILFENTYKRGLRIRVLYIVVVFSYSSFLYHII